MHVVSHLLQSSHSHDYSAFSHSKDLLLRVASTRNNHTAQPENLALNAFARSRRAQKVEVVRRDRPDGILRVRRRVLYAFVQVLLQKDSNGVLKTS